MVRRYFSKSRKGKKRSNRRVIRKKSYGTKKYSLRRRIMSGTASYSRFVMYRKPSYAVKVAKRAGAADYLYNAYATSLTTGIGYSSALAVSMLGAGNYVSAAGGFDNELGAIQYRINGAASGNDTKKTTRFILENMKAEYRMINQDNAPLQVTIYDLVAKRDHNLSPQTCFTDGLADQAATAFTTSTLPPGVSPTMSVQFNNYFKVLKSKRMVLEQGKYHTHSITLAPNRIFNSEIMKEANLNIAGITHWVLVVVNGYIVNGVTAPTTDVSFGSAKLDIGITKTTKYSFIQDITTNFFVNTNPATVLTGGESVMNVGTGTVTSGAQA